MRLMLHQPISEIAKALNLYTSKRTSACGFAIDSRKVIEKGLFFAIKGDQADGHNFLKEVAAKGGCAAVVDSEYRGPNFGMALLRVKSVREALHSLAKKAFSKKKKTVVAITGSMGKTTVKEFLATLLESKYDVFKTEGNQNTQLTVPLALLNLEREYDAFVLEMGMSEHGHIQKLVDIAPPQIAVVTRIAPAGLTNHEGGLKAIARAKSEIFSHPKTRLGVISAQAAQFDSILYAGNLPKKIYGPEGDHQLFLEADGVRIDDSPLFQLQFTASHLLENFLGAVSVCRALGLSWHEIGSKVAQLKPFDKRFEVIDKEGVTFIQDSYNANPDSVVAALQNLPKKEGKVIGVLGAMPDLGETSSFYHAKIGIEAAKHLDQLFCIGEDAKETARAFSETGKPASFAVELAEIKEALERLVKPGDVVLIKGGNFLKLWTLLEA